MIIHRVAFARTRFGHKRLQSVLRCWIWSF